MKRMQQGISMVSLVITIIVIIILAAVAFSGSRETIGKADFSGYVTDIESVRTAFITEGIPNLMGQKETKNNTITKAQAYNYLAKGATTNRIKEDERERAWLSKSQASAIPCTRIEKRYAKEAIGIKLPKRKVNTYYATGIEIEYFVTNKGDIFTWPPFFRSDDGLYYVNDTIVVAGSKVTSGDWIISGDDEIKMYEDGFAFMVNGVEIKIQGTGVDLTPITIDDDSSTIKNMASVGYEDKKKPDKPPVGLESSGVYQDDGTIAGVPDGSGGDDVEEGVCAHTWDNGVQTVAPTTTTKGIKTYTCTLCGETKTEEIPVLDENSVLLKVQIGDYVNYSAQDINSWRVFDIINGEVLITPSTGPTTTKLTLKNVDGYVNGLRKIEEACDVYMNSSLGITENDVRSMTVEDINRVTGYTPAESTTKYAYFLDGDSTYSSTVLKYNGYTKTMHQPQLANGWTVPRFYTWDYAENVSGDENGNMYAYPSEGKPVYVTHTNYFYNPSNISHIGNSSVKVGSLLGSSYGWIASTCVGSYAALVDFDIRCVNSSNISAYYVTRSYGFSNTCSYGVRPLVSIGSNIKVTRVNESSPWILSK